MSLKILFASIYVVFALLFNDQLLSAAGIHHFHHESYAQMEIEHSYDPNSFLNETETSPKDKAQVTLDEAVSESLENIRLPQTVFPQFYDLVLQVHMHGDNTEDFYFNGSVTIKIQCLESTKEIFVHSYYNLDVSMDKISIFLDTDERENRSEIPIESISYEEDTEWYHIILKDSLQPNVSYQLIFGQFRSILDDIQVGLYLSRYVENGTYKYLASTELHPTYARLVFPCWDEPGFKAVFQVTIIRHKDFHTLSNMPLNNTVELYGDWRQDEFQPSVKMSPYLLAFVISQLHGLSEVDSKGRNFTVWTRPEKLESARYAVDIGRRLLTHFEDYFGVPYPLPKMDMVAIPNIHSLEMENWGLITCRESEILWNPNTGSAASKELITNVIAHEISHQWFGNLVTMKWWNNLWLSEGFANFFEYIGTDFVQPNWKVDRRFIINDMQAVMLSDASMESHPIITSPGNHETFEDIYDLITHSKAASIIRMMQSFLGEDVFLNGLKIYLQDNKYKNTDAEDLWSALDSAVRGANKDIDIKAIMDTWTKQPNYPILIVNRVDSNLFHFRQIHSHESYSGTPQSSSYNFTWKIPITYATRNGSASEIIWMNNATMSTRLNVTPNDWYIINTGQTGYYRVHYADNNWELLTDELLKNSSTIPDAARPQIIGDLFQLALYDNVPYTTFLNLTRYLSQENQYAAWVIAGRALLFLDRMLLLDENYGRYQAYVRHLVNESVQNVDWITVREDEDEEKHLLRRTLARIACHAEHESCLCNAKELFKQWMSKPETNPIPPGLRPAIYCAAIKFGGQAEWDFLKSQYSVSEAEETERKHILAGLSCSRDIQIMKLYFQWIRQDSVYWSVLPKFSASPIGNRISWDFVHGVMKSFKAGIRNSTLDPIEIGGFTVEVMKSLSNPYYSLNNKEDEEKILNFEADWLQLPKYHPYKRRLRNLLTISKRNSKWRNTNLQSIIQWLKENVPDTTQLL